MLMPAIFDGDLFDDLFDDMFAPDRAARPLKPMERIGFPVNGLMKTDVKETANGYDLDMDLPGYTKDDVKAELKKCYLVIHDSKEKKDDEKDKEGTLIRQERYSGMMQRSFYVGENIRHEDIKAKFEDGILKLAFPKEQPKKVEEPKYISIEG